MSDSRLHFLKIYNKHTRIVQNNYCGYGQYEITYLHLETTNKEKLWSCGHFSCVGIVENGDFKEFYVETCLLVHINHYIC